MSIDIDAVFDRALACLTLPKEPAKYRRNFFISQFGEYSSVQSPIWKAMPVLEQAGIVEINGSNPEWMRSTLTDPDAERAFEVWLTLKYDLRPSALRFAR